MWTWRSRAIFGYFWFFLPRRQLSISVCWEQKKFILLADKMAVFLLWLLFSTVYACCTDGNCVVLPTIAAQDYRLFTSAKCPTTGLIIAPFVTVGALEFQGTSPTENILLRVWNADYTVLYPIGVRLGTTKPCYSMLTSPDIILPTDTVVFEVFCNSVSGSCSNIKFFFHVYCSKAPPGYACTQSSDCTTGNCRQGICCPGMCASCTTNGLCLSCTAPRQLFNFTCVYPSATTCSPSSPSCIVGLICIQNVCVNPNSVYLTLPTTPSTTTTGVPLVIVVGVAVGAGVVIFFLIICAWRRNRHKTTVLVVPTTDNIL